MAGVPSRGARRLTLPFVLFCLMKTTDLQRLQIHAAENQRKAMKLTRWARLDLLGAGEMIDSALLLRSAADALEFAAAALRHGHLPARAHTRTPVQSRVA